MFLPIKKFLRGWSRRRVIALGLLVALLLGWNTARTEDPKLPLSHDEDVDRAVYLQPRLSLTEDSMHSHGATVGVQNKDGRAAYIGTDTSAERPKYSVGGESRGDLSFSAGVESDGKEHHGVKAGVKIRY